MELAVNMAKKFALFAVVGVALALVAPYLATAVGIAPDYAGAVDVLKHTADPKWLGLFFGAFGAIDAAVAPVIDRIFGDDKAKASKDEKGVLCSPCKEHGKGVVITNLQMQPDVEIKADIDAKANLVGGNENMVDSKAKANFLAQLLDAKGAEKPEQSLIPR